MIEMTIDSIRGGLVNSQFVVILKEKTAERYLPIWIGPSEANAIAIKLRGDTLPRPLTHDLLLSTIEALGASIAYVVVNDLKNDTFYAEIVLNANGEYLTIDSRPSDAIALAVRSGATIYVEEPVMDRAGLVMDKDSGKIISASQEESAEDKLSEEDMKRLSVFKNFIDNLDLGDFDQRKS